MQIDTKVLEQTRMVSFGTNGDRGQIGKDFTASLVARITQGLAEYLHQHAPGKIILIGYDTRRENQMRAREVACILAANKIKVNIIVDNFSPTPVLAYLASSVESVGGVVNLTASHSPYMDGGFKFSPHHGGSADKSMTDAIQNLANKATRYQTTDYESAKHAQWIVELKSGSVVHFYVHRYILPTLKHLKSKNSSQSAWEDIVEYVRNHKDFCLVVDPMQGTAVDTMKCLYGEIAKASGRLDFFKMIHVDNKDTEFKEVGGSPKPDDAKHYKGLVDAVKASGPNAFGVSVDGDADRFGNVDFGGEFVSANQMIGLLAFFLNREVGLAGSVGKTVASSNMINAVADFLKLPLLETAVGFKWMVEHTIKRGVNFIVAGEESAHVGVGPFMRTWDDGIAVGLMGLWIVARTKKSLVEYERFIEHTIGKRFYNKRETIRGEDHSIKNSLNAMIKQTFKQLSENVALQQVGIVKIMQEKLLKYPSLQREVIKEIITVDGVKVIFVSGDTVLWRPSGTEPAIKLYIEVTDKNRLEDLYAVGKEIILS